MSKKKKPTNKEVTESLNKFIGASLYHSSQGAYLKARTKNDDVTKATNKDTSTEEMSHGEAAKSLGCHIRTVYKRIERKELKKVTRNGKTLVVVPLPVKRDVSKYKSVIPPPVAVCVNPLEVEHKLLKGRMQDLEAKHDLIMKVNHKMSDVISKLSQQSHDADKNIKALQVQCKDIIKAGGDSREEANTAKRNQEQFNAEVTQLYREAGAIAMEQKATLDNYFILIGAQRQMIHDLMKVSVAGQGIFKFFSITYWDIRRYLKKFSESIRAFEAHAKEASVDEPASPTKEYE